MVAHYVRDVGVGRSSRLFSTSLRQTPGAFLSRRGLQPLFRGAAPKVPCGSRATDIALRAPSRSPPGALRSACSPVHRKSLRSEYPLMTGPSFCSAGAFGGLFCLWNGHFGRCKCILKGYLHLRSRIAPFQVQSCPPTASNVPESGTSQAEMAVFACNLQKNGTLLAPVKM